MTCSCACHAGGAYRPACDTAGGCGTQHQTSRPECACGRPVADNAYLCSRCTDQLARQLGDVPALAAEVETTRLRQSRTGGSGVGVTSRSSERPLPWDDRPVKAAAGLRNSLVGWVRIVFEEAPLPPRPGGPACADRWCGHESCAPWHPAGPDDTLPAMSRFLLTHLEWLRHQEPAGEAKTDLEHHVARLRASVDRRAEQVYAGPCGSMDYAPDGTLILCSAPCPEHLYGRPNARSITCRTCGAEHDAADRRQWLLAMVYDELATAGLLSGAVSRLGFAVSPSMIRGYLFREKLESRGVDSDGKQLFRVGDVVDLVIASQQRRAG